jgi:hypothetical protein
MEVWTNLYFVFKNTGIARQWTELYFGPQKQEDRC